MEAIASADRSADSQQSRLTLLQTDSLLTIGAELLREQDGRGATDTQTLAALTSLLHTATHDPLTGLPTRSVLLERLNHELTRPGTDGREVAVLFVDLDNFKLVNDSLGHDSGDIVLREMARRICGCVGPCDTVSRFGGDELVILHPGAVNGSEEALGARIVAAMAEPISVSDREVVVGASVGVTSCLPGAQSADQLLRDADTALYDAKRRGRNRVARFNDELHAQAVKRMQIESDLRIALRDDTQLFVLYQPQVNLKTHLVVGVEALARWRHPTLGLVPPAEFIPIAEDSRLIGALGRQVLRSACRQLAEWSAAAPGNPLTMTVNLSPRQLEDPGFVADLQQILDESGISPDSLCLELTESALMSRETDTVDVLERIRGMGVYLAIDDFGTEHSSLARLRDLPAEVLKIDRSFIDGLPSESGDTAIVSSILSLAFAMGKHVIAEGVERPEQAAALSAMGCSVAQGYLFSRAVEPSSVLEMLGRPVGPSGSGRAPSAGVVLGDRARSGYRSFIDEFLYQIGAPMGTKPASRQS
jgi:diguanylate cyclase (GGDEF)-like protein